MTGGECYHEACYDKATYECEDCGELYCEFHAEAEDFKCDCRKNIKEK